MILAIESATDVCSVAFKNEAGEVFEKRTESQGSHSEQLFQFIEKLMQNHGFRISELNAMLVSEGPGSYTGLRISASAVKGLLFQTEVPLFSVNTLASFAMSAADKETESDTIHSIIDARRVHFYHQKFSFDADGNLSSDNIVEVIPIDDFESIVRSGDIIIGTGLDRIDQGARNKATTFGKELISAESLIELYQRGNSAFVSEANPESFDPRYYTSNQV